jgi:hypothetical protein
MREHVIPLRIQSCGPPPIKEPDQQFYGNSADPVLPLLTRSETSNPKRLWPIEVQIEVESNEAATTISSKPEYYNDQQEETNGQRGETGFA